MKNKIKILTAAMICVCCLGGCGNETAKAETTKAETAKAETAKAETTVRIAALKGPTAMGMVKMMEEAESDLAGGNSYEFTIAASVDEVVPRIVQDEVDLAAVPANLAAVLYGNTKGAVQVLAVNTLGVLYIVDTTGTIMSVSDLKGKTIYASGKGGTPEYALNYILTANGINPQKDVTMEWKSEHSECIAVLSNPEKKDAVALLPQPFVTTAQMKNDRIKVALDLTKEWDKLAESGQTTSTLITGAIVVRTEFAKEHPDAVNAFMDDYKESVDFVNTNVDEAAVLIENYDIVPAAVAKQAIPYCHIVFMEGAELKEKLAGYLEVLYQSNPKSVGGKVPADDFYYNRQK